MMIGVTIGEMSTPMIAGRAGIAGLARPSAAKVPSTVASTVAQLPISTLLPSARSQLSSPATVAYQRSENASGWNDNMPSVKVKYGSALKLNGTTTRMGAIRNTSTAVLKPTCR